MNKVLEHVLKGVSATLMAIAHPDPVSVINAIKADYELGDDIYEVIKNNLSEDDHIQNLLTANDAQKMIDNVNNDSAVDNNRV